MSRSIHPTRLLAVGASIGAIVVLAACGGSSDTSSSAATPAAADTAAVDQALSTGGKITVWAWEPTLKDVVSEFQKKYPKVEVNLVNAGTGDKQYTALQNAIKAGSGVPDVAQLEYYAIPQFSLGQSVADLNQFGAGSLDGTFTPGPWGSVKSGNSVYGLPMDSGPMAMFYNKTVFDKYGITVPTTWDGFVDAAQKLHAADPRAYIAADTGDAGFATSMIWQAGGRPFKTDGTNVTVNLSDDGSKKYAETWQKLIDGKLLAPISGWSDEWYKGLGDGTIATLTTGAWMPASFESGVASASGQWRVAPMPQWSDGGKVTAENGGSSLAVTEAGTNKALAYAFTKFATVDEGVDLRVKAGAFPATTATLSSPDFLAKAPAYFGGQKINEVLAESAKEVGTGWSYLPFQVYANSIFNDTVGKAYTGGSTLAAGLTAWQDASSSYGQQQGFTVNK